MEEYKIISATTLSDEEKVLYTNANGAIVRTILMHNTTEEEIEVTLSFDGVIFMFKMVAKETIILDKVILTKLLKAKGNGVNIHISGIELQEV